MKKIIVFMLLLFVAMPAYSQNDCGNGLPCGPVPWRLPQFPDLNSPTPANFVNAGQPIVVTATPNPFATNTPTPFSAPTDFFDAQPIQDNVETIEAIFNATDIPIFNAEGTPMSLELEILENSQLFFSYAKGFSTSSFGPFTPIINFIVFAFLVSLVVAISAFAIPVIAALVGIVRKIIELVLDFIPF